MAIPRGMVTVRRALSVLEKGWVGDGVFVAHNGFQSGWTMP